MEKYKKILKTRIGCMAIVESGILLFVVLDLLDIVKVEGNENFTDLLKGFQFGLLSIVSILFIYLMSRYTMIIRNENELKELYFAEYDERYKMIREKTGGTTILICAIIILLGGIIGGYFNEIVFFTLVGCSLFLFIVRKVLTIYYRRKY